MALIYQANEKILGRAMHWKLALASALPAAFSAAYLVPSVYLTLAYPMVFAPVIYGLYDAKKVTKSF